MLELDASQIQMGRVAANKGEALAMLGDALAEEGRTLGFTRLQAFEISRSGQAGRGQRIAKHGQSFVLVRRSPAHLDLAGIEFEHSGLRLIVLAKTSR